jgi:hypothetical protein
MPLDQYGEGRLRRLTTTRGESFQQLAVGQGSDGPSWKSVWSCLWDTHNRTLAMASAPLDHWTPGY